MSTTETQIEYVTPEHYEIVITTEESTAVSTISRKYLVIAGSEEAAVEYVQGLHPTGAVLVRAHRSERRDTFEVAS